MLHHLDLFTVSYSGTLAALSVYYGTIYKYAIAVLVILVIVRMGLYLDSVRPSMSDSVRPRSQTQRSGRF